MRSHERVMTALRNQQPDQVPAAPDMYEMVPIRLSGRPSWEMLLYEDPPIWKGRVDAVRHFGVDGLIPLWVPMESAPRQAIIHKEDEKIITRHFWEDADGVHWSPVVIVYGKDDPSAYVPAATLGIPDTHETYEEVHPNNTKRGKDYFEEARAYAGGDAVIGPMVSIPSIPCWPEESIAYCEDPDAYAERIRAQGEAMMQQAKTLLSWKPDVLFIGNSGMMIFNPPHIFRHICLEWLQKVTRLAKDHGVLTHMHCCGVERDLVEISALETDLTSIEPLEPAPMGDCDLGEIKRAFGKRMAFKGNLHTTRVMLMGSRHEVEEACKKAIDDAGEGGGFILSTGDQTPRDTPEENILAMREIAGTYGRY